MDQISISYCFTLEDGSRETFDLELDAKTLNLVNNVPAELPAWTELGFFQCPNCPLPKESEPHCPAAANLANLVEGFARVLSHDWVSVEVLTAERTMSQDMPAQRGIGSLMGLVLPTSGCPRTAFFRPMARFHLPWASEEETVYRATSTYLLAQYFRRKSGQGGELDLDGLSEIYQGVREVNRAFAERLRAASEQDSTINAIVVLDTYALTLPWAIGSSLEGLRHMFEPFLRDES